MLLFEKNKKKAKNRNVTRGCPKSVTAPFAIVYFGKK